MKPSISTSRFVSSALLTLALLTPAVTCGVSREGMTKNEDKLKLDMSHGLARGFVGAFTFWLEVPRKVILDVNRYPLLGIFSGAMEGVYLGVMRGALSVADLVMFGLTGPSAYDTDFPEFIWDAQWNPYADVPRSSVPLATPAAPPAS